MFDFVMSLFMKAEKHTVMLDLKAAQHSSSPLPFSQYHCDGCCEAAGSVTHLPECFFFVCFFSSSPEDLKKQVYEHKPNKLIFCFPWCADIRPLCVNVSVYQCVLLCSIYFVLYTVTRRKIHN